MAGWRARGYVADSDDEDDSQTAGTTDLLTSPNQVLASQDLSIHIEKKILCGKNGEIACLTQRRYSEASFDVKGEKGRPATEQTERREDNEPGFDDEEVPPYIGGTLAYGHKALIFSDDIDELGQDHYKPQPTPPNIVLPRDESLQHDSKPTLPSSQLSPVTVSRNSSVLSSLPSSPKPAVLGNHHDLATVDARQLFQGPGSQLTRIGADPPISDGVSVLIRKSQNDGSAVSSRGGRSFRQRNPIQLHPYAIESEKYRQSLRCRGIKPLHITYTQPHEEKTVTDESQVYGIDVSEQRDSTTDRYSPPSQRSSPLPAVLNSSEPSGLGKSASVWDEGDELPDLASLLRSHPQQFTSNGNKRRKTVNTFSRKKLLETNSSELLSSALVDEEARTGEDDTTFGIPASPPPSAATSWSSLDDAGPKFRIPRGFTPTGLPTPLTSSVSRRRPQPERDASGESDEVELVSSAENEQLINQSAKDIERVQRRIRGVLPASWLRLDQKVQVTKSQKSHQTDGEQSHEAADHQRGVARVVTRPQLKSPSLERDLPIELSSDEDSRRGSAPQESLPELDLIFRDKRGMDLEQPLSFIAYRRDRYGEVEEDNRVDAMLPSLGKRKAGTPRRSRKRTKHYGQSNAAIVATSFHEVRRHHHYQPKITDQLIQKPQQLPKFRPPKLSILDVTELHATTSSNMPQFLRIASRTVRSRSDKGRHSPTRKLLKMHKYQDTADINTTLQKWREGTIQPKTTSDQQATRKPLEPRSGNGEFTRLPSWPKSPSKQRLRTKAKSMTWKRSAKSQTSLDNIVPREPVKTLPQPRRFRCSRNQNQSKEPLKRSKLVPDLRSDNEVRPAVLETLQVDQDFERPEVAFRKNLLRIKRSPVRANPPDPTRNSTLHNSTRSSLLYSRIQQATCAVAAGGGPLVIQKQPLRSHRKQCYPKRIDVDTSSYRHSDGPHIADADLESGRKASSKPASAHGVLFSPFGDKYSPDFDIAPLPAGVCFDKGTFVGSGKFQHSSAAPRFEHLDEGRGPINIRFPAGDTTWDQWNDEVSTSVGLLFDDILDFVTRDSVSGSSWTTASEDIVALLDQLIDYTSLHLSFIDPVDRDGFLQRCMGLVTSLLQGLAGSREPSGQDLTVTEELCIDFRIKISTRCLVFASQLSQIAEHDLVPNDMRGKLVALTTKVMRYTMSLVLQYRFAVFPRCLRELQHLEDCESTISTNYVPIEALIVCCTTVTKESHSLAAFWQMVNDIFPVQNHNRAVDVHSTERLWQNLFTLLPFLEFNSTGYLEVGRRFKLQCDNWTPIKQLVSRLFEAYETNSTGQSARYNPYLRAVFARCFQLIANWHWSRCEGIIGTLFDFFARKNLAHLRKEECHSSPTFLEHLAGDPYLSVNASDRCFHILLKLIAKGLQRMRQVYPAKKIRDIVWRLMPNHGRSHPKDEELRQEDLGALRNHHDLLCTLYWASPPDFRPRLTVLRNLVQLETSHREVCHLNIRAWSYLVQFQLSAEEPLSSLQPFANWHDDLLEQILRQHAQARTEAQEQARVTEYQGGLSISKELLETTIARNQRQVEAVLGDALVHLKFAIAAARGSEAAQMLLTPALNSVLDLYNANQFQSNDVIVHALDVLMAYAKHAAPGSKQVPLRDLNDDSQDYGDWSAFADATPTEDPPLSSPQAQAAVHLRNVIEVSLRHLLSNCFGADAPPKDELTVKIVDVWTTVASILVRQDVKTWTDYLSQFGRDSWASLRETQQTRKYGAYYLARLIEVNEDTYFDYREHFLRSWIKSLVERESMLKFQHRLTSALLNVDAANPLLKNLPFWAGRDTGRFDISSSDFSSRRLSLITSILSNMREAVNSAGSNKASDTSPLKQEYKDLLKQLMAAMKHNYQELGSSSNVRGSYVDFAHKVVEALQQHTSTICPVDRFFTDSSAFPLPVEDPLYVVGQLKSYGLRLQDSRTPKQLAVFLQSVMERAVSEGQQQYLISQLHTAIAGEFEHGESRKPTLRSFVVQAIIPPYLEIGFSTPCGWALLSPLLQAQGQIFAELLNVLDGANEASIAAVISTLESFLLSVGDSLQPLLDDMTSLQQPDRLHLLSLCFQVVTTLLPTLDYIIRLGAPTDNCVNCVKYLKSFSSFTSDSGPNMGSSNFDATWDCNVVISSSISTIRIFTMQELKESLSRYWTQKDGYLYIARGNTRKEMDMGLKAYDQERDGFLKATEEFIGCLDALPAFRNEDDDEDEYVRARTRGESIGLRDVLI